MAIVLPHGVLFRGGAEAKIRQTLLENGHIYAVIGLPANIFFNTSIPTTIIVLKKDYTKRDVLFIDASEKYEKARNQNTLSKENIKEILEAYKNREFIDKFAYLASFEELKENEFNLNIPRYVDTFEPEPEIPLVELAKEMVNIETELASTKSELFAMLGQLTAADADIEKELEVFKSLLMDKE